MVDSSDGRTRSFQKWLVGQLWRKWADSSSIHAVRLRLIWMICGSPLLDWTSGVIPVPTGRNCVFWCVSSHHFEKVHSIDLKFFASSEWGQFLWRDSIGVPVGNVKFVLRLLYSMSESSCRMIGSLRDDPFRLIEKLWFQFYRTYVIHLMDGELIEPSHPWRLINERDWLSLYHVLISCESQCSSQPRQQ
jgi:hypothetical protein